MFNQPECPSTKLRTSNDMAAVLVLCCAAIIDSEHGLQATCTSLGLGCCTWVSTAPWSMCMRSLALGGGSFEVSECSEVCMQWYVYYMYIYIYICICKIYLCVYEEKWSLRMNFTSNIIKHRWQTDMLSILEQTFMQNDGFNVIVVGPSRRPFAIAFCHGSMAVDLWNCKGGPQQFPHQWSCVPCSHESSFFGLKRWRQQLRNVGQRCAVAPNIHM